MSVISDGTHKTPNYVDHGVPFLSVQNISKGYFDLTRIKYITQEEHEKLIQRVKPEKNDILICRIGTLGKAIKCTVDFEFSIFVSLGLLRPIEAHTADYIIFAINSPLGDKWIQDNKVGGGTHTYKINLVDIPNMLIPIPPLNEQYRIFAKIQEFDAYIREYDSIDQQLCRIETEFPEALKKSILQQAVKGKLVPQDPNDEPASVLLEKIRAEKDALIKAGKLKKDKHESIIYRRDNSHYEKIDGKEIYIEDEIPFEIPESWEWVRLGSIIHYQNGYAYSKSDYSKNDKGIPVIKSNNLMTLHVTLNIKTNYIEAPTEKMLETQIYDNDLLMCLSSQSENTEPLGKTAIYDLGIPALLNQRVLKMTAYDLSIVEWLYYSINSEYFHYTVSHRSGGSAQSNLKLEHVLTMLVPIPPYKEQLRIIDKINNTFMKISAL